MIRLTYTIWRGQGGLADPEIRLQVLEAKCSQTLRPSHFKGGNSHLSGGFFS